MVACEEGDEAMDDFVDAFFTLLSVFFVIGAVDCFFLFNEFIECRIRTRLAEF